MISFTEFYLEHQFKDFPAEAIQAWKNLIRDAFLAGCYTQGYRQGVILVKVESTFRHSTVTLTPEEPVLASFSSRVTGETPRKKLYVERLPEQLPPAKSTFVVLYHRDVLAEDGDLINTEWGVVAHLTSSLDTPEPMHPDTLIANHFKFAGGTATGMSPIDFETALRESVNFWKDKVTASVVKPDLGL